MQKQQPSGSPLKPKRPAVPPSQEKPQAPIPFPAPLQSTSVRQQPIVTPDPLPVEDWLELETDASGDAHRPPFKAKRIHLRSPALSSAQARQQAWTGFLTWLDVQLQVPEGPPWHEVEALVSQVLVAVQQEVDPARWFQWRLRAQMRHRDPRALRELLAERPDIGLSDTPLLRDLIRLGREGLDDPVSQPEWRLLLTRIHARLDLDLAETLLPGFGPVRKRPPLPTTSDPEGALPLPSASNPAAALAPWLTIEKNFTPSEDAQDERGGHWSCRVVPPCQAPRPDDEWQAAQTATFQWMLAELEDPEGLSWPQLMNLLAEIEAAWALRYDRRHLLSLCVWTAQQRQDEDLLRQFLPTLETSEPAERPLDALIEQAHHGGWGTEVRNALLERAIHWLPRLDEASGEWHAQCLKAVFALPDPGHRDQRLQQYKSTGPFASYSETSRLLETVRRQDPQRAPSFDDMLDDLKGIQRREAKAVKAIWWALAQQLLEWVAPPLARQLLSSDATLAAAANALTRQLLWRLSHPETGDKAQPVEDQFDCLSALVNALPPEQRRPLLKRLDEAYAQQIAQALTAFESGRTPRAPINALAMRGAIRVLAAACREGPPRPKAGKDTSITGLATHFFAEWFDALQAQRMGTLQPSQSGLKGAKLMHDIAFFPRREDPLAEAITDFTKSLFALHGIA